MAKIKLEHVSMRFGDFYAVKDINLGGRGMLFKVF